MKRVLLYKTSRKNRKVKLFLFILVIACGTALFVIGYVRDNDIQKAITSSAAISPHKTSSHLSAPIPPKITQPIDIDINDLWVLTNQARAQNGLAALSLNPLLDNSATAKCNDMVAKDY